MLPGLSSKDLAVYKKHKNLPFYKRHYTSADWFQFKLYEKFFGSIFNYQKLINFSVLRILEIHKVSTYANFTKIYSNILPIQHGCFIRCLFANWLLSRSTIFISEWSPMLF